MEKRAMLWYKLLGFNIRLTNPPRLGYHDVLPAKLHTIFLPRTRVCCRRLTMDAWMHPPEALSLASSPPPPLHTLFLFTTLQDWRKKCGKYVARLRTAQPAGRFDPIRLGMDDVRAH